MTASAAPQINQDTMGLILEYARYHATPGHSDKVRFGRPPNIGGASLTASCAPRS